MKEKQKRRVVIVLFLLIALIAKISFPNNFSSILFIEAIIFIFIEPIVFPHKNSPIDLRTNVIRILMCSAIILISFIYLF